MDRVKPDLEADLYNSDYIMGKAYTNEKYCGDIYYALCNNDWIKADMLSIVAAEHWHCSWRYAGGVAAGLFNGNKWQGQDNYLEFYMYKAFEKTLTEGLVTDEVREDFKRIGWYLVENGNKI